MKKLVKKVVYTVSAIALAFPNVYGQENPESRLGWKIQVQTVSWGLTPLLNEFDKADSIGIINLQAIVVQPVSEKGGAVFDWNLPKKKRLEILEQSKKRGIRISSIGVVNPPDEAGYIKLFEFAKDMEMDMIATEPEPKLLPVVAKLAKQYRIKAAIHNHPYPSYYFQPDSLIKYLKPFESNPYIGACADIGHWFRLGYDIVSNLKLYQSAGIPIFDVHFKDLNEKPSAAYTAYMRKQPFGAWDFKKFKDAPPAPHDVPWGTGISNIDAVIKQLVAMNFKGYITAEYEYERGNNTGLIAQSVKAFREKIIDLQESKMPEHALLAVNTRENVVTVVNAENGEIVKSISVGNGPHEVAVSEDGNYAIVSNYGGADPGKTISVVDLKTLTEIRKVDLGPLRKPHGMEFWNGQLYFTAEVNKLLGIYDPVKDSLTGLMGTGQDLTHALMIDRKRERIFTSNVLSNSVNLYEHFNSEEIKKFNLTEGEFKTSIIAVGKGPHGLGLSPDGDELWVSNTRDSSLSIVDLRTKKEVAKLHSNFIVPKMLTLSKDGKLVFITEREGALVVFDRILRKEIKRFKISENGGVGLVVLSRDGKRAYATAGDRIAVVDLEKMIQLNSIILKAGLDGMTIYDRN